MCCGSWYPVASRDANDVEDVCISDLLFEWDEAKAYTNEIKHGIGFVEAATIFADPHLVTYADEEHSDWEARFISIGLSARRRILLAVHTERATAIRIISCRKVTKAEQRTYEQSATP